MDHVRQNQHDMVPNTSSCVARAVLHERHAYLFLSFRCKSASVLSQGIEEGLSLQGIDEGLSLHRQRQACSSSDPVLGATSSQTMKLFPWRNASVTIWRLETLFVKTAPLALTIRVKASVISSPLKSAM